MINKVKDCLSGYISCYHFNGLKIILKPLKSEIEKNDEQDYQNY